MTLLVGEEKLKFDLHQRNPLTNEERRSCMKIKSSFPLIKEKEPVILQYEGYKFEANSFPTKELAFELLKPIIEVEKFILTSDEDKEGALAMKDKEPNQSS